MLEALTTLRQHLRHVLRLGGMFISLSENRIQSFGTEANQSVGIVSHRPGGSCDSANKCFAWQSFSP